MRISFRRSRPTPAVSKGGEHNARAARRQLAFALVLALAPACASRPNVVGDGGRYAPVLACFARGAELVRVESERGEHIAGVYAPARASARDPLLVLDVLPSGGALMTEPCATRLVYDELHEQGCAVRAFGWRGVGASDGERSSDNVAADARAMWSEALRRADGTDANLGSALGWSTAPFVDAPLDVDLGAELERARPERVLVLSGTDDELLPAADRARLRGATLRAGGTWLAVPGDHVRVASAAARTFAAEVELLRQLSPGGETSAPPGGDQR